MLFKSIIQNYGTFLSSGSTPDKDPVGYLVPDQETQDFRRKVMDDIGAATIYVLDAEAADYLDSFREDVMGGEFSDAANQKITSFMSEVDLPQNIMWLEYDHASLFERRLERGHVAGDAETTVQDFGQRGFLIDNSAADHLTIMLFRIVDTKIIDPMIRLQFEKELDGRTRFKECRFFDNPHMGIFYSEMGKAQSADLEKIQELYEDHVSIQFSDTTYDAVLAFMLLAAISSKDDGINAEPRDSLSAKEMRTARKFGKTWITDKVRDHIVIHIGEPGRRHLAEQSARRRHERALAAVRQMPIQHWVSEHERRYKDGKIITVQGHLRGSRSASSVPRYVKGPVQETS